MKIAMTTLILRLILSIVLLVRIWRNESWEVAVALLLIVLAIEAHGFTLAGLIVKSRNHIECLKYLFEEKRKYDILVQERESRIDRRIHETRES